jgi:hypothetical protein
MLLLAGRRAGSPIELRLAYLGERCKLNCGVQFNAKRAALGDIKFIILAPVPPEYRM